jgi:hypothetical protein
LIGDFRRGFHNSFSITPSQAAQLRLQGDVFSARAFSMTAGHWHIRRDGHFARKKLFGASKEILQFYFSEATITTSA